MYMHLIYIIEFGYVPCMHLALDMQKGHCYMFLTKLYVHKRSNKFVTGMRESSAVEYHYITTSFQCRALICDVEGYSLENRNTYIPLIPWCRVYTFIELNTIKHFTFHSYEIRGVNFPDVVC